MTALSSSARSCSTQCPSSSTEVCGHCCTTQACFCKSSLEKWILLAQISRSGARICPGGFLGRERPAALYQFSIAVRAPGCAQACS